MVKISQLYAAIPDLSGKVALVTGGNAGIGKIACRELLSKGAKVYMAARSKEKAETAITELRNITGRETIHWLPLDLSDLTSIRNAAEQFKSQEKELHILINNAGIMATPLEYTKDGYEAQWGTNVVGHFALTKLLLPVICDTAAHSPRGSVRIVNVSSASHKMANEINFDNVSLNYFIIVSWLALIFLLIGLENVKGTLGPEWQRYFQSKLANILITREIAKKFSDRGIISVACHPGYVKTQLVNNAKKTWIFSLASWFVSPNSDEEGAYSQVYGAAHPKVAEEQFEDSYIGLRGNSEKTTKVANDADLATKLWVHLEKDVASKIPLPDIL